MYLVCEMIDNSFFKIGKEFGGWDYLIVFYVYNKIKNMVV